MKIVNLTQFRALPALTLFSKYAPCYFEQLEIKGDTWETDFLTAQVADAIECDGSDDFSKKLDHATETVCSLKMDFNSWARDGCFDKDQLFAVWEADDLKGLIARITECLAVTQPTGTGEGV